MKNNHCKFTRLFRFYHHSRLYVLLLSLALLTTNGHTLQAHPYLPLESGSTKVYSYHFHIGNAKKGPRPNEVHGEIVMKYGAFEEKYGKRYLRQTTTYRNIPYWTAEQHVWHREESGNLYLGWAQNGKWHETLELPKDVSLGREWRYFDGEQTKRKISKIFDLKLADGKVLADCLEVSRTVLANQQLNTVVNISYYCRDIGNAGSLFRQPTPVGDYTTETRLQSYPHPQK